MHWMSANRLLEAYRKSTVLGRVALLFAALLFVAQLFFVPHYANDKTSMVEQMAKSYSTHGGLIGRDIRCVDLKTGEHGIRPTFIEEFPIFPYTAAAFAKILPGETYQRWTPALYHLLCWIFLSLLLQRFFIRSEKLKWEVFALYGLLPIVVIHETKLIPDPVILSLALIAIYLFTSPKRSLRYASLPFFFLAGLTKPLALALVAPFALGYALFSGGSSVKRWSKGVGVGVFTALGFLTWLAIVYFGNIDNAFLRNSAYHVTQLPDLSTPVGTPAAGYWSRYITWVVSRGISWPLFLLLLYGLFRIFRDWKTTPAPLRIVTVMTLFSPVYWALVRGPQYSGPWYSLYVMPGFIAVIAWTYQDIGKTWLRAVILSLLIISSAPKVKWKLEALNDYRATIGSAFLNQGTQIDCNLTPIIRAVF